MRNSSNIKIIKSRESIPIREHFFPFSFKYLKDSAFFANFPSHLTIQSSRATRQKAHREGAANNKVGFDDFGGRREVGDHARAENQRKQSGRTTLRSHLCICVCVQVHCSFSGLGRDSVKRTVILFSKCNLTWRRTCVRSTATTVRQFVSSANTLALSSSPFSPLYPFFSLFHERSVPSNEATDCLDFSSGHERTCCGTWKGGPLLLKFNQADQGTKSKLVLPFLKRELTGARCAGRWL